MLFSVGCDGGNSCCNPFHQCSENEGDCDNDYDCLGHLICLQNNCPSLPSFEPTDDCCWDPNKRNKKNIIKMKDVINNNIHSNSNTTKCV